MKRMSVRPWLEDANLTQCVPMALRGAFQSCGQNCAGWGLYTLHPVYPQLEKALGFNPF
jgi:acyl-CoA reductase-like NAD-dependent aldehyde dehydrogenase